MRVAGVAVGGFFLGAFFGLLLGFALGLKEPAPDYQQLILKVCIFFGAVLGLIIGSVLGTCSNSK